VSRSLPSNGSICHSNFHSSVNIAGEIKSRGIERLEYVAAQGIPCVCGTRKFTVSLTRARDWTQF
jgi:hypothetical protein